MSIATSKIVRVFLYILFFGVVLFLFHRFSNQNIERIQEQNKAYAEDSARQIALRIDDQFASALNLIKTYAYFLEHTLNGQEVSGAMLAEIEGNSPFDRVRFFNAEGRNVMPRSRTLDVSEDEFFKNAMNGGSGVTVMVLEHVSPKPLMGFYAPVRHEGKVIGVLLGTFLSDNYLRSMLKAEYFGQPAQTFLCMPSGDVVASYADRDYAGNILASLQANGAMDASVAGPIANIFRDGGAGVFSCDESGRVANICVMYLPSYKYVLLQAYPQTVTEGMVNTANRAGFQLELGLVALFAVYAAMALINVHMQRARLEKKNQELGMVSQGMNILYSGRYCMADLDKGTYDYIGGGNPAEHDLAVSGPYENVIDRQASVCIDPEKAHDFRSLFSAESIGAALAQKNTVTYLCHVRRQNEEEWENFIAICLERRGGRAVKFLMVRQNVTDSREREIMTQKKLSVMDRKERQFQLALTDNAMCSYEFNVTADRLDEDVLLAAKGHVISLPFARGMTLPCPASRFLDSWEPMILAESEEEYRRKVNIDFLRETFRQGRKEVDLDFWCRDMSGGEICVRQSFYLAQDELTGDVMAMSVMRDITEQVIKQRAQTKALKDALMLAQHANEAKTTFLSNMSHDIRTPMNAIIGFATIAASHLDNTSQVRDCLQKVLSSSNHLLSLINDILDMSRIESGKMQLKEQECNIPELMHNLVTIIQPQVKAKQMQLFIDTFEVNNEEVITDPLKLNQVFINLLGNAVKYTPAGGVISFRLTQKPAFKHGWAEYVFEVKDNGIGMSPEFVKHLFEPFTRETTSTISGIQGTGLGMAITKNIIEMMNGAIEVDSAPGKGTTFKVSLPMRVQETRGITPDIKALEGLRALVVDDDFHVCDSVHKMLKKIGMRAEWTTSGREAVYRAQSANNEGDPYHTYIIDWHMPDMNGVETSRNIRATVGSDAPIIILTAYEWADIEEDARKAGVSAFCAKPLFMSDLKNALLSSHNLMEKAAEEPVFNKDAFKGSRVLVVDDLEMNREVAEFILTESGFIVDCAPDGTDAVEIVRKSPEHHYDAILMDVQMPTMNGYEATRTIRNLEREDVKSLPIIAMTANALEEDKAAALKSGMNDHISKPIEIKVFFQVLGKYLNKQD